MINASERPNYHDPARALLDGANDQSAADLRASRAVAAGSFGRLREHLTIRSFPRSSVARQRLCRVRDETDDPRTVKTPVVCPEPECADCSGVRGTSSHWA